MNGPTSPTEIVGAWADEAAGTAARGDVCEENLRALLRDDYDPARAWSHARAAYLTLLERLATVDSPLVLKLIVPLAPRRALEVVPPSLEQIEAEVDCRGTPPMLVVHPPLFQRSWEEFEKYQRPFEPLVFVADRGEPLAEGLYVAFRDRWEIADDAEYRRELLFERLHNVTGFAVTAR